MTVPENLAQYDTEENRKAYEALVNGNASAASTATSQVPDDLAKYDTDENRKAYEAYSKEHAFDNGFTVTYNGQTTSYTKEETDLLKRAYQALNQNADFAKSALESYGNNAFDQFAMQNGLPSWKLFSKVQKYAAGGGVAENYGNLSDEQWKKINELWAKDWEYGLSDQDYARKAAGLAPVSYDSMYEDTLLDQELKAKGLPPSKLLNGKLGEAYNTWVKDTNTRNDILQSIANDYVSGKLFFAENPATGKKETIDYDDADFMTSAILAAQSDPRYSEFFKNHYGVQQELPDEHDPKYIMYTKDPISGEKTPLYDESGSYLYDTNAWMEDRQKIINENTALADDEFAITPDIVKNYITENGLSITADIATEKWFKANDPKFEHATRMANPEYIAKLVDFASAYEFVGEGGVTLASLFPNKQFTLAERTELQPLIDKINTRALEQGMGVYEEYFKGGEWARDVHQIENNNIVAQYRENYADVDGYNDPNSKNYHSDDKILNDHYENIAKEYGIDKDMPLVDAVAKLRSGELNIDSYLTDKCKTPEDAEAFAKMRYENYCKANNLPTTEEGWEENRELRSAAHDYINNELGDQQQDMLDTPESEWQNQHDVWGKIASKYKTKAEALKAQQNGAMPEHSQFDSVVAEWEYAVDKYAKASEALDIYAHIHELDPTWNNESARYEQQQYGTPVQASANAVRLSYLGESLSYAYKNVNIDNVEQRARQLFEDKAGIGMSSGLVLKSGALGAAGVLAGAPLPVGSAIAGALLSDSDKRKNMDALYDELTEEEKQKLVYMSMQYGTDSDNVKDYINSVLLSAADRRRRQEQQAENGYWFSESESPTLRIFGGMTNTLASALFIQPTESLANFISDTINIKTGNELLSSMRSNLGQDNISNIASNISEKAGKGWAFAYQLAPSMIQSVNQAVAAYLTKGASEIPTLISMAMQSYSSAVDDALQRGVSSKEAYYYGIMNGVAEYVFEKVSLDKFLSESNEALDTIIALKRAAKKAGTKAVVDRKLFAKAWLTILKNAPIQGIVEMSEETWTSLANYLSETALLSVDSSFDKYVEHYKAGGMSQEEAEKKAKEDVAKEIFGEGAAGFISGMLMSGGRSVMMMTSAAGTVHIDRTGMSEFLNATHNLSTISAVEAGNYVRTRLDLSGNSQITARQVASVMNELIRKGADAATLMRVRNEILAAKPSAAVGTVMNNIISEQSRNDAKRLINAAQRYITRTNKNGKTNISAEAIATVTNEYLSALQTRAQDRDVRNIQYATERIRSEYIANIASKTGASQTASGMSALNEYFTALPQASQTAIQKDAEKYKVKFNGTGMTETDAAQYALYASILHDACTEANSTGAYTVLFGESAAYTPMAIENACLNSTGEEAAIFIDSVCDAIAALNGSTGTLTTAAMNGSNATAFAATQMAIARESSNVRAKAVYDYIVKHGASSDLMDMLTAANMLESLSPVERFALMSSIRVTGNNMMTNVQLDDIVGTYTKARENYEGQKRVMEEHQKSDAQKVIDEDARIAMYDTQIATLDAQIEAETDPKLKGTLMEKRADNAKARQDAITAKEEETRRRAERMASTQKELNSAKSSADKAQNDYNRSMRRHAAQYMQRMGDIYQGIMAHDHLSLVSIASKAAAVNYGDAKNLNDVQEIIRASEKASAVALGRMMGITVEVVEFSEKFFDEKNVPKEYRKPNAPGVTIDGKVYLNEKSITAEVGSGTNAVILHEIGHVMEASADNYVKYAKFARQYFETRDGKESVDRWIASLVESGMTEENANKELVAEFTRQVALADPRAIRALTKSAPIMSMRIFQWLTNMKSALTPQALEQATTLRDAQLAFARAMKTVKKSGSEVSSVYDVAVNRAAIDNANETLDERARLEEQAKQTKTEQKTETPTATDEQQTTQTETPATTEETQTQPAVEETEQAAETVEEQPSETAEEMPEETPTDEQPVEEPKEDFADVVLNDNAETRVDETQDQEYNDNRQPTNLPFELSKETRDKIMRVVSSLRVKNSDADGRVPSSINNTIQKVVEYQVKHDANYIDTPADVIASFAEQFKAPEQGAQYYTKYDGGYEFNGFKPTEQQLHDPAWYSTSEAQEYWANHPAYKNWKHPNLAYISAAARNQVTIPYDELANIPEIRAVQNASDEMTANNRNSADDYRGNVEREQLQNKWVRWIRGLENIESENSDSYKYGSARYYTDENGNQRLKYDGPVAKEKKAFIILGRPASGKSSVFADPYSNRYNARIIDSDLIKEWMPEIAEKGGAATDYVHNESAALAERAMDEITGYYETKDGKTVFHEGTGENIVIPRVGTPRTIAELVGKLTSPAVGYEVAVLYNDLSQANSIMRAMSRFAESDRYIDLSYLHDTLVEDRFDVRCWKAFEQLANNDKISYLEWRDNNVRRGQNAIERWNSNDRRTLAQAKQDVEAEAGQHVVGHVVQGDGVRAGDNGNAGVSGNTTSSRVSYYNEYNPEALDREYLPLAEKHLAGEATIAEQERLRQILDTFAMRQRPWRKNGKPARQYTGQRLGVHDFTPSSPSRNQIFTTSNMTVADSYTYADDDVDPHVVEIKDQYILDDDDVSDNSLLDNARRLLGETWEKDTRHATDETIETVNWFKDRFNELSEAVSIDPPPEIDPAKYYSQTNGYGPARYDILTDIREIEFGLDTVIGTIEGSLDTLFGISSQYTGVDLDTIRTWLKTYTRINDRLSTLFASDPKTFNHGETEWYYKWLTSENGDGLISRFEAVLATLEDLANEANEYSNNGFIRIDPKTQNVIDAKSRDELYNRVNNRKRKAVYGVYVFQGDNPSEIDVDESQWYSISHPRYAGHKPRTIFDNARKDDNVTSMRFQNIEDWGSGVFKNTVNRTKIGDNIQVPSDENYFLVKSADLVTLDENGQIILPSQRFNLKKNDISWFTEYNPEALAVQRNIDDMTDMEKSASGNPRILQSANGPVVVRTFTKNGFTSGNPMTNGNGLQNIAMIAPVAAFEYGFVDRAVPASKCTAVVIPNTDEYADMRTDARDAGAYVYGYDPSDPSMLDRAVDRAKDAQSVQYMPEMRYEDFLEKYGAHPYGAEPRVKNRPVPRRTTDTNRVSQMASNAATSPMTTEQGYEDIQGWIANHGTGTFTPQSNNRVLNHARGVIERAGDIHQAAADLDRDVANGIGKATDLLARAELLYAQTQDPNSGLSVIEREKIFGNLCIIASDAGRALQLASRLKYMTPEGHIAYIEQVGKRIADKYEKRTGKRTVLKPTQEEIDAYKGAQTVEEMEEIDKKVSERFGEETSDLTWIDRVRNWRYFSMLGNPRTHFRNIVGNALMNPVARVKDSINSIYQLGMDKSDRTTAFVTKRADENTREFVNQMLEENLPRMQGVSEKYMEGVDNQSVRTIGQAWKTDVKSAALTKGRTAIGRALNRLSSFNSNMLELEDAKALSRRFRSAMYQIIQARGIDVSNITEQQKSDIVNYAMEESLRATFRDASALADALNKFANTNKATRLAMEAIVPFKRTPINIAKRSVEYSPIGLVNGLYKLFSANSAYNTDIKNIESMQGITDEERAAMRKNAENTLKQNKIRAIDRLAAGTTGSLMTLIGMFASAMGWISIGRKDDEEAAFEQGLGKNTYSLNIGDLSIDLSAFSPAAVPLLMGTALYQAVGAEHDENFVSSMISVLAESVDPVTEMSMLSGIADALSSTSYGNEEGRNTRWFGAIAGNALESYVGQFVPTFVGQVNRTIDPYARSYTAGDDYWATKAFGSEIGSSVKSIQNKVFPWLSEPKVNIHGEEQRNYTNFGSWVRNFANNMLLPATIKVDQKNEIDDELIRLYGVVDSADLFPTKPSRNLGSYDNMPIKITSDSEYMQYQMEYGQTVYDMLEYLMSSPAYRMMTDTQKADAVERIIDQAKSATKKRWKAQKVANMR